jgi:ribonuclease HI
VDLANGYWQLRMQDQALEYLGFEWRGKFYTFTVLPFGIKSAPWGFQKLMREFCAYLRAKGVRLINYLDDFLFMLGMDMAQALRARDDLLRIFKAAGLGINTAKSQLQPVRRLQCLGYIVDSGSMRFELPPERWAAFQAAVASVEAANGVAHARDVAKVAGHAVSMHLVVGRLSRLFTRACTASLLCKRDWDSYVPVTPELRDELRFWRNLSLERLKAPIIEAPESTAVTVNTDASAFAWAGVLTDGTVARGSLSQGERATSSAQRELLAVHYTLQSFEERLKGRRVHILTDSANGQAIMEHGSGKAHLQRLALSIFWWCQKQGVRLSVSWVPREQNTVADCFSKLEESCDFQLHPQWFGVLDAKWGPHTVDRFASTENALCKRFNALYHCPGAEAVDCFAQNWRGDNNWCNPPFSLMGRLWAFLRMQGASATVIAPVWRSATWWPLVCQGATWSPAVVGAMLIPRGRDLFVPGTAKAGRFGVGVPKWDVVALRVSFCNGWQSRQRVPCGL